MIWRKVSVPEMPEAGHHHCQSGVIGRFDHFIIAHRAARLDHRSRTRLGGSQQAIGKGEKRIGGYNRTFGKRLGQTGIAGRFTGFPCGNTR